MNTPKEQSNKQKLEELGFIGPGWTVEKAFNHLIEQGYKAHKQIGSAQSYKFKKKK